MDKLEKRKGIKLANNIKARVRRGQRQAQGEGDPDPGQAVRRQGRPGRQERAELGPRGVLQPQKDSIPQEKTTYDRVAELCKGVSEQITTVL